MYPSSWDLNEIDESSPYEQPTPIARLLQQANSSYYVKLQPVDALQTSNNREALWKDSYTKLLAFNLTQFDRVLALDSDSMVLGNLDDLFLLPRRTRSNALHLLGRISRLLILLLNAAHHPSATSFSKVETAIKTAKSDEYDMDVLTYLFKNQILRIPQRPYSLLSSEFRLKTTLHI